jgi:hypothetical protein
LATRGRRLLLKHANLEGFVHKERDAVAQTFNKLEHRYGPTMAKVIIGTGAAGLPIPIPGASLMTAAPALAAGELSHAYSGDYEDPIGKKRRHRKDVIDKLKTWALPAGVAGGAGLAGLALHKPTSTLVPSQVTKFPGEDRARVVRGPIYPGALASVLEDTGGGYQYLGPKNEYNSDTGGATPWKRLHGHVEDPETFGKAVRSGQRPGHPLEILEIQGHGRPEAQGLGTGMSRDTALSNKTVDSVAEALNEVPHSPDASVIGYGCNTGLCTPPAGSPPQRDWWQRLADLTGMKTLGARGYTTSETGLGTWQDVHHTGPRHTF